MRIVTCLAALIAAVCTVVNAAEEDFDPYIPSSGTNEIPEGTQFMLEIPAPPIPSGGAGGSTPPTTMTSTNNFLALADNTLRSPPDTMGAVNANYAMTMLNTEVGI